MASAARQGQADQDPRDWLLTGALYSRASVLRAGETGAGISILKLAPLLFDPWYVDCYCVECEDKSTFHSLRDSDRSAGSRFLVEYKDQSEFYQITIRCARNRAHRINIWIHQIGEEVVKVGQTPSAADLQFSNLRKYKKVVTNADFRELSRAIGLSSHGANIGAFVYLRRVFEKLIFRHYSKFIEENDPIDGFERMRMPEKVDALKSLLPPFLVQHRSIYGILSTGIHELSEDECAKYFGPMRDSILLILEQDAQAEERRMMEADLGKSIQTISSGLS